MKIKIVFALLLLISQQTAFAESKKPNSKKTSPISDFDLGRYQYCGTDSDCVVANNGCCDCANGGKDVAVNKDRLEAFKENFNCLNVACTEMASEKLCGSGVVSCINHKCQYLNP